MKVLYVDQTGKLGGGEIAILPWICHAREDAAVVLLEDGPFRSMLEDCGIPVEVMNTEKLRDVRRESGVGSILVTLPSLWKVRQELAKRARDFDVLYANSQKAFLLSALAKRRGQPLIWHLRDILTAEHFSPVLRRVAVTFGNWFAARIVANSQATADSFVAAGGDRRKIRVVHDGVAAGPFDEVPEEEVRALRAAIPAPAEARLIGLFGRISPWKGQHVLLEAIRDLPDMHAVLVGDALFGEEAYAEHINTLSLAPELTGRVHFLGFRRDIPALMKSVDVIAHTSTSAEPFGLVIVEGMLALKPVIATRAGGALEIASEGSEGDVCLLTAPGSAAELRKAISIIFADPASSTRLVARARRRAEEAFSLERLFSSLVQVFQEFDPTER